MYQNQPPKKSTRARSSHTYYMQQTKNILVSLKQLLNFFLKWKAIFIYLIKNCFLFFLIHSCIESTHCQVSTESRFIHSIQPFRVSSVVAQLQYNSVVATFFSVILIAHLMFATNCYGFLRLQCDQVEIICDFYCNLINCGLNLLNV